MRDGIDEFLTEAAPSRRTLDLDSATAPGRVPEDLARDFASHVLARLGRRLQATSPAADLTPRRRAIPAKRLSRFCAALVGPEPGAAMRVVEEARVGGASPDLIYEAYIAAGARELGARWVADSLGFWDVTLGLGRLHAMVQDLGPLFLVREPRPRDSLTALFAAVPGETHVLGITLAADYFRRSGWQVDLLTAPSTADLQRAAGSHPALIGLSAGSRRMTGPLARTVERLRKIAPEAVICVGGHLTELEPALGRLVGADLIVKDAASAATSLSGRVAKRKHAPA